MNSNLSKSKKRNWKELSKVMNEGLKTYKKENFLSIKDLKVIQLEAGIGKILLTLISILISLLEKKIFCYDKRFGEIKLRQSNISYS